MTLDERAFRRMAGSAGWRSYARQTDGDWERSFGVRIETLDNPGWRVRVNLADTELADRPFTEIAELEPEREWLVCRVREGQFEASGGPFMLERILRIFTSWAAAAPAAAQQSAAGDEGRGTVPE